MSRATTLVLFLLVVGLGVGVWWNKEHGPTELTTKAVRLFPGVDASRVRAIFIDNVERSVHLKLERDEGGRWALTDPVAYAAAPEVMDNLFYVIGLPARTVTPEEYDYAEQGFDPPRAVLEVTESMADGAERKTRLELGAQDLDGNLYYARVDGRTLLALANVDTILQRSVADFRSRRVFEFNPREVVAVHRSGALYPDNAPAIDIRLDAERRGQGWWMDHPRRAQVDPDVMSVYIAVLSNLRIRNFTRDHEGPLEAYGLDNPHFGIRVADRFGIDSEVVFAQSLMGAWYCMRVGQPYVFLLEDAEVRKATDEGFDFLDLRLLRMFRHDVSSILLASGRGQLRVTRDPVGERWTVADRPESEPDFSMELPADDTKVDEILALLETAEIPRYLTEESAAEVFPEGSPRHGVWIEDANGERQGGRIGARYTSAQGTPAYYFHRARESLVALVTTEVGGLLDLELSDLLSPLLFNLDEVRCKRLRFALGDETRTYLKTPQGTWKYADLEAEATELHPVLDLVFFLRASEHLGAGGEELEDVVTVEILDVEGTTHFARIGRTPDGRVEAEILGLRSVLARPDLHEKLLTIFRG